MVQKPRVEKLLLNNDVKKYLENILLEIPEWDSIRNIIDGIVNCKTLKRCNTCGKYIHFNGKSSRKYCSNRCAKLNEEEQEKYRNTCIERFSETSPMKCSSIKDKAKNTCLARYGVNCSLKSNEVRKKIYKTNLEKYGTEIPSKNNEVKQKTKETCKNKYSGNAPICSNSVKEKMKNTLIERYDVDNCMKALSIKNKVKNTCIEKYGFEHHSLEHSWNTVISWKNYIIPMFERSNWHGWTDKEYEWKCTKCGDIFKQKIYCTAHIPEIDKYIPRCLKCYPMTNGFSYSEIELLEFCRSYFQTASKDKELIAPLELDVVIPEIKLAIEFNGSYWHCIINKNEFYHLNKTKLCNEKGYRLIHIWEDEWINNREIIEKNLKNIFENNEDLNFKDDEIILDRSWYNNIDIPGYVLKEEKMPEIIIRNNFEVENCGKLVYIKI